MANKSNDRFYLHRILILGLTSTGIAVYLLSTLLTFKFQLIEVKGVIQDSNTHISTVKEKSRGTKSQKSELTFFIHERKQIFRLIKNIGGEYRHEEFENLSKSLKKADSVSVWIKRSEVESFEPKVFQIDVDNETILKFEKVRTEDGGLFLFMFVIGIFSLIFYFSKVYPEKTKNLFRFIWPEEAK